MEKVVMSWESDGLGKLNSENELTRNTRLTVNFLDDSAGDDLCSPHVSGGYLGTENQTIRVQLTGADTFTWGFDNASPLYKVAVSGVRVTFLTAIKDQQHWPLAEQIVEILPRSAELSNNEYIADLTGSLRKVATSYSPNPPEIELKQPLGSGVEEDKYLYLRVWNRGSDLSSDAEISFTAEPLFHWEIQG